VAPGEVVVGGAHSKGVRRRRWRRSGYRRRWLEGPAALVKHGEGKGWVQSAGASSEARLPEAWLMGWQRLRISGATGSAPATTVD
jgi:hypothetical protein